MLSMLIEKAERVVYGHRVDAPQAPSQALIRATEVLPMPHELNKPDALLSESPQAAEAEPQS